MSIRLFSLLALTVLLLVGCEAIERPERCLEPHPLGEGICYMLMNGFYFDQETETCKEWHAGGCSLTPSRNSFASLADCTSTCIEYN